MEEHLSSQEQEKIVNWMVQEHFPKLKRVKMLK